jgi:hypothetical protein
MRLENLTLTIKNLDDFIYTSKATPSAKISFDRLSRVAHTAHDSINRRYRIFMRVKRSDDININKARAKRCCNMVKKHIHDLKKIRAYLYKHNLHIEHPVFANKVNLWIDQCERIHSRYKHHINDL